VVHYYKSTAFHALFNLVRGIAGGDT
jgi:hypothetical protein